MAHFPFVRGQLFIQTVDMSTHVVGADLEVETAEVEDGPCMMQMTRKFLRVIKNWTLRGRLKLDFAAAQVHATIYPLWKNDTDVAFRYRATDAAISATNPEFQGTGILKRYQPLSGNHGDVPQVEIEIIPTGTSPDLVEDITP